jgi:hypothetical protein
MAAPNPTPIYHLTHVDNLTFIIQSGGCLSFSQKLTQGIDHINIAYETIQDRRARAFVPFAPGSYFWK